MRILGKAFKKKNPDTTITVFPSLGSGGGLSALIGGAIDIAISSRLPKDKESKAGLKAIRYGTTALVIATAGKQSLPGLTSEKLIEIYANRQAKWPDGQPIRLVLRPLSESDTILVTKRIKGMGEAFRKAETPGAIISETDQQEADALAKRPTAIGISAPSLILGEKRPFKMIPLNGVTPSVETLKSGQYPLPKSLYMVTRTPKTKDIHAFMEFIQSSEGRKILGKTGHLLDN